jgi:hypothetical protein
MERLETLESVISGATMAIEKKIYDRTISLDDEAIKQFLASVHRIAADSEGKFRVIVSAGREYWVLAEAEIPPIRHWYFRYVPDGTAFVLSDGNAI